MPKYDDTNRGALFKNTRKENDKGPDYRGQINVGGDEFWIAGWMKKSKDGKPYMSLAVTSKQEDRDTKHGDEVPF